MSNKKRVRNYVRWKRNIFTQGNSWSKQCRGKAAQYLRSGGAPTIRRGPTIYIVLVS